MRRVLPILLTLAVLLGSTGVSWSADFQKGLDAHNKRDYATALREWTPFAEQGDAIAQFILGQMYRKGRGVPKDDKTALKWYIFAAEQGLAVAQFSLGLMYRLGRGVPEDDKTAAKWYRLAAEQGTARAQYNLGLMYLRGHGVPQNYKTAVKWWTRAAEQGNPRAQRGLEVLQKKLKRWRKFHEISRWCWVGTPPSDSPTPTFPDRLSR